MYCATSINIYVDLPAICKSFIPVVAACGHLLVATPIRSSGHRIPGLWVKFYMHANHCWTTVARCRTRTLMKNIAQRPSPLALPCVRFFARPLYLVDNVPFLRRIVGQRNICVHTSLLLCTHHPSGSVSAIYTACVPAQGSFVSSGQTRVLSLRRSTMEARLGPLQSEIDQAGVRMAKGEAMKEKNETLVASLQVRCFAAPHRAWNRIPYTGTLYQKIVYSNSMGV